MADVCLTSAQILKFDPSVATLGFSSTGTIQVDSVGAPGDTIDIGGVSLTAVAGARTSGSDDFSLASGTTLGVATDIVAALGDASNSFTSLVTGAIQIPGVPTVQLTSVATGYYSTLPLATSAAAVYVLSGATLTGGEEFIDEMVSCTCGMLGDCWGVKKDCAHRYLALHFLTVASGGAGGPVSSRTIDRLSESYAITPPTDAELGSTKWGLLYLALKKTVLKLPQSGYPGGSLRPIGVVSGGWPGGWYP